MGIADCLKPTEGARDRLAIVGWQIDALSTELESEKDPLLRATIQGERAELVTERAGLVAELLAIVKAAS